MRYGFIDSLKTEHRVTELQHAFRINGVVDVWKGNNVVYDIVANKYIRPETEKNCEDLVMSLLTQYPGREDFKKAKNGISYQEFKNTNRNQEYKLDAVHAEDYHWGQNNLTTSEDHLYFAIMEDKVKIGRSKNPKERIKTLSTGLYKKPKVYVFNNKGFMETKLHGFFKEFRLSGEWFKFDIRIQHFLKKHHTGKVGYILFPETEKKSK